MNEKEDWDVAFSFEPVLAGVEIGIWNARTEELLLRVTVTGETTVNMCKKLMAAAASHMSLKNFIEEMENGGPDG